MQVTDAMEIVKNPSSYSFASTVDWLTAAIGSAGMSIFVRIDHAAVAEAFGFHMAQTIVLCYANATAATLIVLASPTAALDLPLRVLIRDDFGRQTSMSYHRVVPMLRRSGVPESVASHLEAAQHLLHAAIEPGPWISVSHNIFPFGVRLSLII